MAWYIESWDVADGYAFAGFRQSISDEPESLTYLSAPHFDPVPVRDVATVRWSARATFQERLYDDDDREVRFGTLEQVIEMVKRGYLAAGTGTPPEGGRPAPALPPSSPEGSSGGGSNVSRGSEPELPPEFQEVLKRLGREGGRAELAGILRELMLSHSRKADETASSWATDFDLNDVHAVLNMPAPATDAAPHLTTFGDHLAAITSDRRHVLSLTLDTLLPALKAAFLVVASMHPDKKMDSGGVKQAADWLATQIPDGSLASAASAEQIIHQIVKGRWADERVEPVPDEPSKSRNEANMEGPPGVRKPRKNPKA